MNDFDEIKDDKTIKWLQDHKDPVFGWKHDLVRFGWSTVRKIMNDPVEVEWFKFNCIC